MEKNITKINFLLFPAVLAVWGGLLYSIYYFTADTKTIPPHTNSNYKVAGVPKTQTPAPTEFILPDYPDTYEISGGKQVFQTFNNCGPASLSMALSFYGIETTQDELGDELRPYQVASGDNDDKSVTLPEIADKAKDYGFVPYYRPEGDIELVKHFVSNDIPVITRTLLEPRNDIGHYRVIYGYDTNSLLQNDSLQGEALKYAYQDYLQIWEPYNYEYLVLVPDDKIELAEAIIGENLDEQLAWEKTVSRLEKEVSNNPSDILARFSLSVAYYNIGEYQKSVTEYEKVENVLPFRTIWYQIEPLLAYQKLGLYEELLPRIEAILSRHNRAFSELYQIRGEIYLEQNKLEQAREEFELALRYNKNFQPAQDALGSLGESTLD